MNLIVLVIDTLRYDHIAAHGADAVIRTPNMDRLAAESWVFHNAFTGSYPTIPHRTDAMTGRCGGPFHPWLPLRHDRLTLPQLLGKSGWCTQLIHDTPHLVNGGHNFDWPFHAWTQERGAEVDRPWIGAPGVQPENWGRDPLFDAVESPDDEGGPKKVPMASYAWANRNRKRDEDWNCARLFRTVSRFLEENASRRNFFLWVDCFDPHEPWDVPPAYARMYDDDPAYDGVMDPRAFWARNDPALPDAARRRVKAHYRGKVSWVDYWVGLMLNTLEETGLARNTALLLTADHGTNLGERGAFGKSFPVREFEAHVPFMVRLPGGERGESRLIVQPEDIFPTVLGLAGLPAPETLQGHDVLSAARTGRDIPRRLALSGRGLRALPTSQAPLTCSAFDGEWCLEFGLRPEETRLTRMGTVEDLAATRPDHALHMRATALDQLCNRGTDPRLAEFLRSDGTAQFPGDVPLFEGWPAPSGFQSYFSRLFAGP